MGSGGPSERRLRAGWPAALIASALAVEILLVHAVTAEGAADRPVVARLESPAEVIRSAASAVAGLTERSRPDTIAVSARVTSDGAPVAGARVSISDGSRATPRSAIAGDDGAVTFEDLPPGAYQLWASHGDRVSALARTGAAGGAAELALAAGTRINGRARARGPLAAGGRALLIPVGLDHAVFAAPVGTDGAFSFAALPRGRWRLRLEIAGHVARREVLFDAGPEPVDLEVPLIATGRVAGQVVDHRGAPVAGATLVLRRRDGRAASRGPAEWTATPEAIRWVHPLAVERHMPMRDVRRFGARRPGARPPECGGGHCGVDIGVTLGSVVHATAGGRIAAVVHDANRLAGRYVAIEHDFGFKTFYMHLDEIRLGLQVGQRIAAGEAIGTLGGSGTGHPRPHLHFALSREIDGRPWFVDPEPMLEQAVVLPEPGSLATPVSSVGTAVASAPRSTAGPAAITTGDDGRFEIDQLPAGSYVAAAYHARLAPGESRPFAITSGGATEGVRIELAEGAVIWGRVSAGGQPVAGARIVAQEGRGESMRTVARATTDAAGRYQLRPLTGELTVRALTRDQGEAERSLAVSAARHELSFELAILEADLFGRVVAADGLPVAGASVHVVDGPPIASRHLVTDAGGRFTARATAGGRYALRVEARAHPPATATLDVDRETTIALRAAGSISAELRDAHTRVPLAGISVIARGPDGARRRAVTDDRGIVSLSPVAVGRWTLSADAPGYIGLEAPVTVAAGRRAAPDLVLSRGAVIGGVLRDGDGTRIAGAEIRAGEARVVTDRDGAFRIADAPTGSVEIRASKDGVTTVTAIDLAPGDERTRLELRLE